MTLDDAGFIVAQWAQHKQVICRVYFFGSRVRLENRSDSDLDIAIELEYVDNSVSLANWIFESKVWKKELSDLLGWDVDVQRFFPRSTKIIARAIKESSILVYEKKQGL